MNLKEFIKKSPKAELHLHIEGTLEPELMFFLAKRNNVEIPFKNIDDVKEAYNFSNLDSFLKALKIPFITLSKSIPLSVWVCGSKKISVCTMLFSLHFNM